MSPLPPIPGSIDPIELFRKWYEEAIATEPDVPNAMSLATATPEGRPSVRMVLMKGLSEQGFVFYTNTDSRKSAELTGNRFASLCFHWKSLKRQVRVDGVVAFMPDSDADAYHASRPRQSQIAAWASRQSHSLDRRETLLTNFEEMETRFKGKDVPRLDSWRGYCLTPSAIEFWQDVKNRLHDRLVYRRNGEIWKRERLYP
jgi:pyridoxamine 5'-phosphate oxidase